MRKALILVLFIYLKSEAQLNFTPLSFYLKSNSQFFDDKYKKSADSALIISATVLNSQEFKDSISSYVFPCKNYSKKCREKCTDCNNGNIPTQVVLDSLYRLNRDSITLVLYNDGNCNGSYGFSKENVFTITSHFVTIECDDSISFAYKYAYHICHEYMHIVGFYHYVSARRRVTDKDIAEKTGWIAYDIIKHWIQENRKYDGL